MRLLRLSIILLAATLLASACGTPATATPSATVTTLKMAPLSALSPEIRQLPAEVQEAYRFALANPGVLEKIPCYCGCSRVGHLNNLMCYLQPAGAGGDPVFDSHAAG